MNENPEIWKIVVLVAAISIGLGAIVWQIFRPEAGLKSDDKK
jgi:hypothetical protein